MGDKKEFGFTCPGYATRRASRAVTSYFNLALKKYDLSLPQFGLLAAIDTRPGQSISAISELLTLDDSTLTRNLNLLEKRGLVESLGGRGRAGKQVTLTKEGHDLASKADVEWAKAGAEIRARMGDEKVDQGIAFLRELEAITLEATCELHKKLEQ